MARTSHRERIHDTIRRRILDGGIGPEDRLVDTAIAEEMGVSRMPVREALMQLVSEGYLEGSSRGFVLPNMTPERIREVFLLRRLLEPHAAASASQARSAEALEAMRAAVDQTTATLQDEDFETFYRASEVFRNTWLQAVPNAALRGVIQRYSVQVQSVRQVTMRDRQAHEAVVQGQQDLFACFASGDGVAAQERMLRFVIEAENTYARMVTG